MSQGRMMVDKKLVHISRMPIRWGDMDAMGHVNNTVYFRYMEQARIEWFSSIDCEPDLVGGEGPVIVNAHCTFMRQLKYPGEIEVLTYIGVPGRSSFETMHTIRRIDNRDTVAAEGGAKVVWINYAREKSVALNQQVLARLAQAQWPRLGG